jgi:hypothetical protein
LERRKFIEDDMQMPHPANKWGVHRGYGVRGWDLRLKLGFKPLEHHRMPVRDTSMMWGEVGWGGGGGGGGWVLSRDRSAEYKASIASQIHEAK